MQRAASIVPEGAPEEAHRDAPEIVPPAVVLHRVEPGYPESARQMQLQGPVVLDVRIGVDGSVQDMALVSGQPLLVQAAKDAVKQWRYQPTLLNGEPVEVDTTIDVIFSLNQ